MTIEELLMKVYDDKIVQIISINHPSIVGNLRHTPLLSQYPAEPLFRTCPFIAAITNELCLVHYEAIR
jgi:hypothetical protein